MSKKICILLTAMLTWVSFTQASAEVLEDVIGRKVELNLPAERVVLGFYAEDYIAIGTEKALENVVGISQDTWKVWRPQSWNLYTAYRPSLADIPDVGEIESQSFSIEKVISLKPSVILLADWQYKGLGLDADRLEDAGIPIVVVDYNAQTLEKHLKSTDLIGKLTGQTDRAAKIAKEYKTAVNDVQSRIANANVTKPKAYAEFGNKGPAQYSFTYGKNMWGAMIDMAGGDNIAAPFVEWWGPMNPEQVLASKPEVVIISGTESTKNPTSMLMGQNVERAEAEKRLAGFTQRAGWSELPAVKNNKVVGVYQGASRTMLDYSMVQFLAKSFYPNLFSDLNPEQSYLDFYKNYLPVTPKGTFTATLQK